jgi:hypothetical protein
LEFLEFFYVEGNYLAGAYPEKDGIISYEEVDHILRVILPIAYYIY